MKVVDTITALREQRLDLNGTVGFVPTMGALHLGHKSLLERARGECESVAASIYVNPTQFGPNEDFDSYPRTLESDLALCCSAGVDLVWLPQTNEMYPPGHETTVHLSELGESFEGASRPGHFQGVATVVTKLFLATQCHRAYFGEKDLQQLFVIKKMVRDLLFNVEIVGVPTSREENGLARSSRNEYLTGEEREKAGAIYSGLSLVKRLVRDKTQTAQFLKAQFCQHINKMMPAAEVERCDFYDAQLGRAFEGSEAIADSGYCAVAVKLGKVRLIDNIALEAPCS